MFFSVLCLLCLCTCLFICALWSPAGKGLTSWLSFVVSNCEFVTFPSVSWVRLWYLNVSIPDLCTLTYYGSDLCLNKKFVMHSCAKTGLNPIQEYPLVLEWGRYQSTGKSDRHPAHFYPFGSCYG